MNEADEAVAPAKGEAFGTPERKRALTKQGLAVRSERRTGAASMRGNGSVDSSTEVSESVVVGGQ